MFTPTFVHSDVCYSCVCPRTKYNRHEMPKKKLVLVAPISLNKSSLLHPKSSEKVKYIMKFYSFWVISNFGSEYKSFFIKKITTIKIFPKFEKKENLMFTHKNWREKKKVFLLAKFKSWLGSGKGIDLQIFKSIHIFELKSLKA